MAFLFNNKQQYINGDTTTTYYNYKNKITTTKIKSQLHTGHECALPLLKNLACLCPPNALKNHIVFEGRRIMPFGVFLEINYSRDMR
jgi:hypothetical protein